MQEPNKTSLGAIAVQSIITQHAVLPKRKYTPGFRMFCLAISGDGTILAVAGEDGRIFTWSKAATLPFTSFAGRASVEKMLLVPGDERLLAFLENGTMEECNPGQVQHQSRVIAAHEKGIHAARLADDCPELFTGGLDGWVRCWDLSTLELLHEIKSPKHGVLSLLSCNLDGGALLFSGNANGTIAMIDADEWKIVHSLPAHDGPVFCLEPVTSEYFMSAGNDDFLRFWHFGNERPVLDVHAGQGKVLDALMLDAPFNQALNVGTEAKLIVTAGGDGTIAMWEFDMSSIACRHVASLPAHDRTVEQFVLDPAGGAFYSLASDGCVKQWTA